MATTANTHYSYFDEKQSMRDNNGKNVSVKMNNYIKPR